MSFSVWDINDRRGLIEREITGSTKTEEVIFRSQVTDLPVIRVPIESLVYRMENGRTTVEQAQHIAQFHLEPDFFSRGQENETAQQTQHNILLLLARDSKAPIFEGLEQEARQTQRLLITRDGVVENGNRRLAAMRFLYQRDPRTYSSFRYVDVAVLPSNATEVELDLLESQLQLAKEYKLDYGWIHRRLKIRRQLMQLQIPRGEIKETYRFRRDEDINVELRQLELAEEYLDRFLGMRGAYWEIGDREQMFAELQKALSGKKGEDREIRQHLAFLLIKESRNLGDRAYRFKEIFGSSYEDVMRQYAAVKGVTLEGRQTPVEPRRDTDNVDDPMEGLETEEASVFSPVRPLLNDPTKSKETAEELVNIAESLRDQRKQTQARLSPLRKVQDANRLLHEVEPTQVERDLRPQLNGQLRSMISRAQQLLEEIGE